MAQKDLIDPIKAEFAVHHRGMDRKLILDCLLPDSHSQEEIVPRILRGTMDSSNDLFLRIAV